MFERVHIYTLVISKHIAYQLTECFTSIIIKLSYTRINKRLYTMYSDILEDITFENRIFYIENIRQLYTWDATYLMYWNITICNNWDMTNIACWINSNGNIRIINTSKSTIGFVRYMKKNMFII